MKSYTLLSQKMAVVLQTKKEFQMNLINVLFIQLKH